MNMIETFTPKEIVDRLDRYIIGQAKAKRSVAIALRNRWRRQQVPEALREEITPKNIIMIGPTGVGKTEIARRIAKLSKAPFIKVEATKFTEVGYVGKDVESIIRDLVQIGVNLVKSEEKKRLLHKAEEFAEERLLDILLPPIARNIKRKPNQIAAEIRIHPDELSNRGLSGTFHPMAQNVAAPARTLTAEEQTREAKQLEEEAESYKKSREKLRKMLNEGKLDDRDVEIETREKNVPSIEIFSASGSGEMDMNMREALGNFLPKRRKRRKVKVADAKEILVNEEVNRLIDMEKVAKEAIYRVEQAGIVFLDEIDKIASRETKGGPDVSREGVQRDLLPIIEGSNVMTKYGMVKTDHILFIASGAFHVSKPSDLIPEMQGRFPIRVELDRLTKEDFVRILKEPENSLTKQYIEMMKTEGVTIQFDNSAIAEISRVAEYVNERTENIGARRLHTVMEKLFEEVSFDAPNLKNQTIEISEKYVKDRLDDLIADEDLSRYIL